ncbi:MAG TPA: NAD-dependent epimerase/dehydratase family protein [Solirubrobacteraceae bacterium]|jgi:dihydroflavonol-4-reductase
MTATRTLVTGATGFVGSHVARALVERGDDVRITCRPGSRTDAIEDLDVRRLTADVTDRRALRRAMKGVERVFHVAGVTSLRAPEDEAFAVNVGGTRAVLGEALRAGVERVVHTSSIAAIGPAPWGTTADETQVFRHGHLGIPYVSSKHAAEVEALRVAARGLDVVVVCPGHVFGAGDLRRSSTDVVRRFMLRRIPAYVDGAINIVHAADVAAGHVLADERGVSGERYILGDRNYTWDRLYADLARLSGIEAPGLRLPLPVALGMAAAAARSPVPVELGASPVEIRATGLWWAYRSGKARRELGWTTRPHEDTVEETVRFYAERERGRLARSGTRQPLGWRLAAGVAGRLGVGR